MEQVAVGGEEYFHLKSKESYMFLVSSVALKETPRATRIAGGCDHEAPTMNDARGGMASSSSAEMFPFIISSRLCCRISYKGLTSLHRNLLRLPLAG